MLLLSICAHLSLGKEAPPLPVETATQIYVRTASELWEAVRRVESDTTIFIAPGEYQLPNTLHISTPGVRNVAIRGETGNPEDVVLLGNGMSNKEYRTVPHGILVSSGANVLIADLTIRDVYFHAIHFQGGFGCERPRVYNCRFIDIGEQFIKANPHSGYEGSGTAGGVDGGRVEYTVMAYTNTARSWYTNGVDVIGGANWTIRHCLFLNIRAPANSDTQAGPAVLMWRGSRNTMCEANQFVNCERGIAFGLDSTRANDHYGGVIRNNIIYRAPNLTGDAGISVWNSPGTKVLHNTVVLNGTYPNAIEYRFPATRDCVIACNLCDGDIAQRDGASATLKNNVTEIDARWFVDANSGNLHLTERATGVMNKAEPTHEVTQDFDGEHRPNGEAADIGADEFH